MSEIPCLGRLGQTRSNRPILATVAVRAGPADPTRVAHPATPVLFSPSAHAEWRFWEFFTAHIRNPNTAATADAALGKVDEYGYRHVIDFAFEGPRGTAVVRSAWIVKAGEEVPRLVTCYLP